MERLRTISESIKRSRVYEAHVDTDQMMYADAIAKALQAKKSGVGHLWSAEIINSGSDSVTGSGGGRIKYTVPAVPDDVQYNVVLERKAPEPKLDDMGNEIPGDPAAEEITDAKISVIINDGPPVETVLTNQPLDGLKEAVTAFVISTIEQYNNKQKVQ